MDLLTVVIVMALVGMLMMAFLYWQARVELRRRELVIRILMMQLSHIGDELERALKDQNVDELFK